MKNSSVELETAQGSRSNQTLRNGSMFARVSLSTDTEAARSFPGTSCLRISKHKGRGHTHATVFPFMRGVTIHTGETKFHILNMVSIGDHIPYKENMSLALAKGVPWGKM